jgi:hypothetical protein
MDLEGMELEFLDGFGWLRIVSFGDLFLGRVINEILVGMFENDNRV